MPKVLKDQVNFELDSSLHEKLKNILFKEKKTKAEVIRDLLAKYVAEREKLTVS